MKQAPRMHRFLRCLIACVLVVGLAPAAAYAVDPAPSTSLVDQVAAGSRAALDRISQTGEASAIIDRNAYGTGEGVSMLAETNLPAAYDMRDRNLVTPVKNQAPWGTCWGFAAIAASETSIVNELGIAPTLDLSERHLAWFAYKALPLDPSDPQGGEGVYPTNPDPNEALNMGGFPFTATSVFSSGIGPVMEEEVPYRNDEGIIAHDAAGNPVCYSPSGTWAVDEALRFQQVLELQESSVLPSPALTDAAGSYTYNPAGTAAIKQELANGRAVEIAFYADTSRPGQTDPPVYIDLEHYAHYTYEVKPVNHAVTIVGWDDAYPKTNFLEGHQPEADGAWIVKNSWGSENAEFPNKGSWGIDGTGYFYLSYYDQSVALPESFDFYAEELIDGKPLDFYYSNQYDYMPSRGVTSYSVDDDISMANIFTAEETQRVRSLATETAAPHTTVTYDLYLLDQGFANPRDGKLLTSVTETYEYGGYHRVDLPEGYVVKAGETFSVVVTQVDPGGNHAYLVDQAVNKKGYDYYLEHEDIDLHSYNVGIVNPGESFLFSEGEWEDWTACIEEIRSQDEHGDFLDYDNFSIKAYSDPVDAPTRFSDVGEGDWFNDVVEYVASRSIMNGYANTDLFGPYDNLARQDLACLLFNYLAPDEAAKWTGDAWKNAEVKTPYEDAMTVAYYTPALNWAYENKVLVGYDDAPSFGVGESTTREQFATVLWRIGADSTPSANASIDDFPDSGDVSAWAVSAMTWCVENGLITGNNGYLYPGHVAARAEAAKMISVFDQVILKG